MLPSLLSVEFARWQFALTAMFHFIFVPLTLGLTWMLFTMELMYVKTGRQVYKDMTRFWGKLFGINFAIGVLTGLTMEFEFGTNWAYYSQSVGDIFGTPLAIEGLAAFMLESTFVGIFFFGWAKLSKKQHLFGTFCLALGSSFSALLILVANGFMQWPQGGALAWQTMRMETTSLGALFFSPFAQIGFAHTVLAGYITGAAFVIGISAFYLLLKRDVAFAKRSMAIGLGFGLIASLGVMILGDQLGLQVYKHQPMKLAAMEAEWTTQTPPAAFNAIAFPSNKAKTNYFDLKIPKVLGLLVTHNSKTKIYGIDTILNDGFYNAQGKFVPSVVNRVKSGAIAYDAMMKLRSGDKSPSMMRLYQEHKQDVGYGMLLLPYLNSNQALTTATTQQVDRAAESAIPQVWSVFWSFRIMIALGVLLFLTIVVALIAMARKTLWQKRWLLRWMLYYMIPAPIVACWLGWFAAEHGRQPWTVYNLLPTSLSSSTIAPWDVFASMVIFVLLYTILFIIELYLMFKFARRGPSSLHTGRYDLEKNPSKGDNNHE